MKLTPRLRAIAAKIPTGSIPVDVGTDHCYIPIYLVKNRICPKAIATEINVGPYQRAIEMVEREGLLGKIDVRLGDGLKVIKPGEANVVVIAGMGGFSIIEILKKSPEVLAAIDLLVLQPMLAQDRVRKYLLNSGYMIKDEDLVEESSQIHEIILAISGNQALQDEMYFEIGYRLFEKRHPLLGRLIDRKLKITESIIKELQKINTKNSKERLEQMEKRFHWLKEAKRNVCQGSNHSSNN